jgi:hypothetical protein
MESDTMILQAAHREVTVIENKSNRTERENKEQR